MSQVDLSQVPPHTPPPQRLDAADTDPNPTYLTVDNPRAQRYPLEVWRVSNGETYAIVTNVKTNVSLTIAQQRIISAIKEDWGQSVRVIEFWPDEIPDMHYRLVREQSGGGGLAVNFLELDACGLHLRPPR